RRRGRQAAFGRAGRHFRWRAEQDRVLRLHRRAAERILTAPGTRSAGGLPGRDRQLPRVLRAVPRRGDDRRDGRPGRPAGLHRASVLHQARAAGTRPGAAPFRGWRRRTGPGLRLRGGAERGRRQRVLPDRGGLPGRGGRRAARGVRRRSLRGIPPERVRLHTCYGINEGPRVHDAPLAEYVDTLFTIRAGAFSFEAANPRHEHVYHVFESVKPPRDAVLLPGVISHATNIVEHPDTIADRIVRFAELVGRENVVASADCGFSSQATYRPEIHPQIVWAKFESLAEGARRATARLWR